ncbi:hypothetical protein JCM11251_002861 [Rhodosporidiobolus azoricus]
MLTAPPLWAQPIASRPRRPHLLRTVSFVLLFNLGILTTFGLLVLLLPLRIIRATRPLYVRLGKGAFGTLLVFVVREFAPTEVVVSGGEGVDAKKWTQLNENNEIVSLDLPDKAVWISNHSTLIDWLYLWAFTYTSGHHDSLYIALKSSLRKIPIIGWSAQLFNFIFLDRKWETDRTNFRRQLGRIARTTLDGGEGEKAAVLIFPEGTITTDNTRGISAKYAAKTGVKDYKHLLLPRSTGLFYALRHLALTLPNLHLIDLTIAYPIPHRSPSSTNPYPSLFASDYYNIPSVLVFSVPPPELHIHIRSCPISAIPLGDLDNLKKQSAAEGEEGDVEPTEGERRAFEEWLKERWDEKERLLERFRTEGSFVAAQLRKGKNDEDEGEDDRRPGELVWRPHLRNGWENLYAFSFFVPVLIVGLLWWYASSMLGAVLGRTGGTQEIAAVVEPIKTAACGCCRGKVREKAVETAQATVRSLLKEL